MATVTQTTEPDLAALAADAQQRLEQLRPKRQLLSLPALVDPTGREAAELRDVESEIVTAEQLLARAELAALERDRLAVEASEQTEVKRIAAARAEAEKRSKRLAAKARAYNQAATALALTAAEYAEEYRGCQAARHEAGDLPEWQGQPPGGLGAALRDALSKTGALGLIDVRDMAGGPDRPLAGERE